MTCTLCGENCWPPCWRSWSEVFEETGVNSVTYIQIKPMGPPSVSPTTDVYLDYPHIASLQCNAQCSGSARGEAPSPRLNEKGGE